jgi:histidyl-tRNA synthetase
MEKPTLPKGTRDFGPAVMAKRQFILNSIRSVFQLHGFLPLETPAMENLSTLTGKYGDEGDQLLFKILDSGDYLKNVDQTKLNTKDSKLITSDISEKGLRYDLTVPFARYVVMNRHEITLPFKRYQIQPVWRADRPQKGRYREFYQCDADVVGTDSLICEAEIILMIKSAFKALGIEDYRIKINHRGILAGIAELVAANEKESSLFVAIDKLDKIGEEKVKEELLTRGFTNESLTTLFEILNFKGTTQEKVEFLTTRFANSTIGQKGIADLKQVFTLLKGYGTTKDHVEFDISLARGLSYYTGCIFEVKINNVAIGSVSGGGRYDNLTQAFGSKEKLSGVGISFGVDRLYDAMEELKLFPQEANATSTVLISHFDEQSMNYGLGVLQTLRDKGIASEIYPDYVKIQKQLDYANKKMIPYVIIIGSEEVKSGQLTIKNMKTGEQEKKIISEIITLITNN